MADPRIRQIKIKTGIVKRLAKEEIAYKTEAKQQEEKIERLKAEAGDDYVIKKQMEVLQESKMMIPDCRRRLAAAHADLLQLLASIVLALCGIPPLSETPEGLCGLENVTRASIDKEETEEDLGETEEFKEARNILDSVKLEG